MSPPAPRLARGLAVVPARDGLLIEGAPRRYWFGGQAATTVLPRVLPLLDGAHDRPALAAATGLSDTQLDQVLGMLAEAGLLDNAAVDGTGTADFYSRTRSAAGGYRDSAELLAALGAAAVFLVGSGPELVPALQADLLESGVGRVQRLPHPEEVTCPASGRYLVVCADPAVLDRTVAAAAHAGLPVLRVAASADEVQLGPVFDTGVPACPPCLRRGLAEQGWAVDGGRPGRDAVQLAAGLAAGEILARVAHTWQPSNPYRVTRITLSDLNTERRVVTPYPGCGRCGADGTAVEAYEAVMRARQPRGGWQGKPLLDEANRLAELPRHRPAFPAAPRIPLPEPGQLAAVELVGAAPSQRSSACRPVPPALDLRTLAGILVRTAGRRDPGQPDNLRRWAPSGGNLASVAAYLLTERDMGGLPGTRFRYDDLAHELVALRADPVPLHAALAGTDLDPGGLDAVVVLVAEAGRIAAKYGDFAYRLSHLDAGCAALQLAAVARRYGWVLVLATAWDERIGEVFELHRDTEFVTVVAGLCGPGGRTGDAASR